MYKSTVLHVGSTLSPAERNTALITSYIAAWNRSDIEKILSYLSPDCEYRDLSCLGYFRGHRELGDYLRYFFTTIVDHRVTIHDLICDGDVIACSWQCSGRRLPARVQTVSTKFSTHGISLMEVHEGRITRIRESWDVISYLQQVGEQDESCEAKTFS